MREFVNKIIRGDCIEVLGEVKKPFADLVFADPPFNIGYKYDKYHDKVESKNYIAWTKDWMVACKDVLRPTGSFYIAIGDDYAANVKVIADEMGLVMRNWIIWHYTFGQQTKTKFARAHTHIFYFVKDEKNFTFNDYTVRSPSDRQLIYNDKRANARGKLPDDVWGNFSRVCGTFNERQSWHPCQMPEILLARIIAVSSNVGDWVLDPFSGSGTTAAVAARYGRKYTGIDVSKSYAKNTEKRLAELKSEIELGGKHFFSTEEMYEIERLFVDVGIGVEQMLGSDKLMNIFAEQFAVRMNNGKKYVPEKIATVIKGFVYWAKKA